MRTLHAENHNNRRKYTEADVTEIRQADAERMQMESELDAKMAERRATVMRGLVSKYGFSEDGAKQLMALIAQGCNYYGESPIANVRFGTEEKRQAAERAFAYYWG